ncbi:MAG: hypothetical protein U1D68_00570, partial [Arthrobacter sp.]|nr:hypothetical protein [Arthrobacter sp.]MDZ4352410.1 hypothetical protein [Arthrobacter sp.]
METVRDFRAFEDTDRVAESSTGRRGTSRAGQPGMDGVAEALATLQDVGLTAVEDAALLGFQAASDFAGTVEEVSRVMEYLQLVAAGAVDRTRKQAAASASKAGTSWTTGWRETTGTGAFTEAGTGAGSAGPDSVAAAAPEAVDAPAAADGLAVAVAVDTPAASDSKVAAVDLGAAAVDDGYRNTTEFLRARLRISAPEARRRLSLAERLLPRQGFTGEPLPPVHGELGTAVAYGEVASRAATI